MIGEIADRRLSETRYDTEGGKGEAQFDVADVELFFQEREQHRQHEQMEMADPMRRRNRSQGAQRSVRLRLLRCGQNVDSLRFIRSAGLRKRTAARPEEVVES